MDAQAIHEIVRTFQHELNVLSNKLNSVYEKDRKAVLRQIDCVTNVIKKLNQYEDLKTEKPKKAT